MNWYSLILFGHIVCAIIWVGAGFLIQVQETLMTRSNDRAAILRALQMNGKLAAVLFMPSSLGAVIFGIGLVLVGGWGFTELWIVLGLLGFATTFCVGLFILKPRGMAIGAMVRRDGGLTGESLDAAYRLMVISRIDLVILFLVVANMVLKPSYSDIPAIAVLGGALVAGTGAILWFARNGHDMETVAPAE